MILSEVFFFFLCCFIALFIVPFRVHNHSAKSPMAIEYLSVAISNDEWVAIYLVHEIVKAGFVPGSGSAAMPARVPCQKLLHDFSVALS